VIYTELRKMQHVLSIFVTTPHLRQQPDKNRSIYTKQHTETSSITTTLAVAATELCTYEYRQNMMHFPLFGIYRTV
jgi:hypothetical protein